MFVWAPQRLRESAGCGASLCSSFRITGTESPYSSQWFRLPCSWVLGLGRNDVEEVWLLRVKEECN